MRRRGEETRNASVGTHAPSRREPEGLISACAALSLLRSTPSRPFSGNKLPLSYQPPAPLPPRRYHPLSYVPFVPLCPPPSSSFFPSSPAVPSVPHCSLRPSLLVATPPARVSLSLPPTFPLFLHGKRSTLPLAISLVRLVSLSPLSCLLSRLSVSFTPFRSAPLIVRACHASPR